MKYQDVHEDLIKILEYCEMSKLPDPFLMEDGSRVKNVSDWERRRAEIYKTAVELQYGKMPPKPEFLEVEPLEHGRLSAYRIVTGTKECPISFLMKVFMPQKKGKFPVVSSGDLCWDLYFDPQRVKTFVDNDIALVIFDRTELAPDINGYHLEMMEEGTPLYEMTKKAFETEFTGARQGQLYRTYPDCDCGAIGAWAWGYSRCVDALELLGAFDLSCITFTGLSRGGKTALLAGALDERAAIVSPAGSGTGGSGAYRIKVKQLNEDGSEHISEPLEILEKNFPFWMGKGMKEYHFNEDKLPFDSHFLKAMVAPRVLFTADGASDAWANPVGVWQTNEAAREVYKLYGKPENLLWYVRRGFHNQTVEDMEQLVNVIRHVKYGEPLNERYHKLPFAPMAPAFDWCCPTEE